MFYDKSGACNTAETFVEILTWFWTNLDTIIYVRFSFQQSRKHLIVTRLDRTKTQNIRHKRASSSITAKIYQKW